MKVIILVTVFTLGAMSVLTGCEKPDYQDPRYRSSQSK